MYRVTPMEKDNTLANIDRDIERSAAAFINFIIMVADGNNDLY